MKTLATIALFALLAAGCTQQAAAPSEADFTHAMQEYLARRGDLCVNRSTWPVDVGRAEAEQGSRNTVQLPVLERLGVVRSSVVEVAGQPVRRYELTEQGKQYYLARAPYKHDTGRAQADHDLCIARLSLKRVVRWEPPAGRKDSQEVTVSYTYDIQPAPWAADAELRHVFPVVDRLIRGAGVLELQEGMVRTEQGWEAREL
jgi:hypothetical protein